MLAGGGVTGVAWELGVLAGLARAGVDLGQADLVVGTSAGSVVGAQITSGQPLEDLLARQLDPATAASEIPAPFDSAAFVAKMTELVGDARHASEARARIGRWALEADTVDEETRRRVIAARLPVQHWPDRDLLVTAVEAHSGDFVTFDRHSGVGLVDAVAASCAVPGVWPPVTIGGRRYVDGGIRSGTNADLAQGCDRVVVLVPFELEEEGRRRIEAELEGVGADDRLVVAADERLSAAVGTSHLDPSRRPVAARAGLEQVPAVAEAVGTFWHRPLPLGRR